jgi:ribosomal protein S12 methylthiotransferase RimO
MKKVYLVSLGCTKNLVDSEVMLGKLQNYSLTQNPKEADVIIVNTCGFIEAAKEESLNTIFNLHSNRKKDSILVMAGCLSERYKDELQKELIEVDIFTGVGDYSKIDELIAKKKSLFSKEVYLIKNEKRVITGSKHHAYIKLSEGCNQQCSFCAIPKFKGKLQSRPISLIIEEISSLVKQGFIDFTFVSQDSSSYLRDFNEKDGLVKLIKEVEKIDGVKSARILYLYPSTTTEAMIEAIANSKIFQNYFDMPIQHISDKMLKLMKRGANAKRTKELLEKMRKIPDSFLRSTIIIGHPNESDEDFNELKEFLEKFDFDRLNIFEYSDEDGTTAFNMKEKISKEIIEKRVDEINKIVEKQVIKSLDKMVGKNIKAYLEGVSKESELLLSARDIRWAPEVDGEILINDTQISNLDIGRLYDVNITNRAKESLIGTIIN